MKNVLLILIYLFSNDVIGQVKGDYNWVGGVGKLGYLFDYNISNSIPKKQEIEFGFTSNNTSISDEDGNLLFFFNGCAVMNRNFQVMPNGDSINAGVWFDKFWKDCLYGYPGFQDASILRDPNNRDCYYLFHKPIIYYQIKDSVQLNYSYIDMRLDDGRGDVTIKNRNFYEKQNPLSAYLTAIKHSNKEDWWIIQPKVEDSIFLTFSLDKNGIVRFPDQNTHQYFNKFRSSSGGTAKFSPDGTKYALYNYTDQLHVYDFDRSTGIFSNHQKITIIPKDSLDVNNVYFSSVEWSPNSRFVYCASYLKLHQVDMWESNPQDGVRYIDKYNGTLDPFPNELFLMAQAPDCKIYMTPKNGSYSIHVINKPDELGIACDFVQNGIKLPATNSGTLPNFPRFRVDEIDKCDPTISSVFGNDVYYRRDIEIFPSPSYGVYQLRMPEGATNGHIVVTDIHGNHIYQTEISSYEYIREIDITSQPSGHYNIEYYPKINPERVFYGRQVLKVE